MSEIKKELLHPKEGTNYIVGADDYIITKDHTLSDILRFLVKESDANEIASSLFTFYTSRCNYSNFK